MTYPLEFEFKVLALAPQFYVRDSSGRNVAYVKQKLFKLKEDISVFEDESQQNIIFKIKANQWIDWSASYIMYDKENRVMGRVGRKGARSLWKATYEVFDDADHKEFIIEEENAFVKIMDGVFSEVPILVFLPDTFLILSTTSPIQMVNWWLCLAKSNLFGVRSFH